MNTIQSGHCHEWQIGSGVHPDIVALNVESLEALAFSDSAQEVTDTPIHNRLNWQYARFGYQASKTLRGWWVSGVDPLNHYQPMDWGRFKPDADTPVIDREKDQPAKYLSPKGMPSRATFLAVPDQLWQQFCQKYQKLPGSAHNFWEWVWLNNIPITLTEGEKKAGCLLSCLYAAIALPGINSGIRTKDADGRKTFARLIPELAHFATPARQIDIAFDYEVKTKTIQAIDQAIGQLGRLFRLAKCHPRRIRLPGPEKGVDDLIVTQGADAYHQVYAQARSLNPAEEYSRLSYPIAQLINQRYVGKIDIPNPAKLVGIKSAKNTGKTESVVDLVAHEVGYGRRVLVLTHRVQLGQALCDRFGIPYITEVRSSDEGSTLGYGVCVDSLHPESQAHFSAAYWKECTVILDEAEQVVWHTLSATTEIKNRRIDVLREMRQLFHNVLTSEHGRIILLDADLSNLSLQFVLGMASLKLEPWIMVNQYQAPTWAVHHYDQNSPAKWLKSLEENIARGGKPFVITHSQSETSRWSTKTFEALFQQKFPDRAILRIDSETIADPTHPAYGCVSHLNEVLPHYDIVLASPSIETGVSIDLKGHFTGVWGCFQGVSPANSVRQALARVRETVPRHVWIAKRGLGFVGNGSTEFRSLMRSERVVTALNLQILEIVGDKVETFDDALSIWGRYACRINCEMIDYRAFVIQGLTQEGHTVTATNPDGSTLQLEQEVLQVRDQQKAAEYEAICQAADLSPKEHETLKSKKTKTPAERHQEQKFDLKQRYQTEAVTAALIDKDRQGWHPKLRLHYYLTVGHTYLKERELQSFNTTFAQNSLWLPTFNRSQISAKCWLLERLEVLALTDPEEHYSAIHPLIQKVGTMALHYRQGIKSVLGITISDKDSPIAIAQKLLGLLGLKLSCVGRPGARDSQRLRLYRFSPPEDERDVIFAAWCERDELRRKEAVSSLGNINSTQLGQEAA